MFPWTKHESSLFSTFLPAFALLFFWLKPLLPVWEHISLWLWVTSVQWLEDPLDKAENLEIKTGDAQLKGFDKDTQSICVDKNILLNKKCWENGKATCRKKGLECLASIIKEKWVQNTLKTEMQNVKSMWRGIGTTGLRKRCSNESQSTGNQERGENGTVSEHAQNTEGTAQRVGRYLQSIYQMCIETEYSRNTTTAKAKQITERDGKRDLPKMCVRYRGNL